MAVDDIKGNLDKVANKAKELGVSATDNAKKGLKTAEKKAKQAQYDIKKKIYNPLFSEEYQSPDFDCPKIVVIEDEDIRKGIDVCEGAIGWLSKAAGQEVLHLYENFVPESGLTFFPVASCESIYYLNPNKENRYINLNCYFETMQQDKLTELKNIAFCLGAKECRLESYELQKEIKIKNASYDLEAKAKKSKLPAGKNGIDLDINGEFEQKREHERSVVFSQKFEGSNNPVEPTLDWYENDKEILSLIKMRMNGQGFNQTKEYSASIDSKLSLSMDINLAAKLDKTLEKLGVESNFTLKGESLKEMRTKLEFVIVF